MPAEKKNPTLVEGRPTRVSARDLCDDPSRRFFKGYPAVTLKEEAFMPVNWQ